MKDSTNSEWRTLSLLKAGRYTIKRMDYIACVYDPFWQLTIIDQQTILVKSNTWINSLMDKFHNLPISITAKAFNATIGELTVQQEPSFSVDIGFETCILSTLFGYDSGITHTVPTTSAAALAVDRPLDTKVSRGIKKIVPVAPSHVTSSPPLQTAPQGTSHLLKASPAKRKRVSIGT